MCPKYDVYEMISLYDVILRIIFSKPLKYRNKLNQNKTKESRAGC
jgi:hypothetical protein